MSLVVGVFMIPFTPICFGTPTCRPPGASVSIWGTIGGGPLLFIAPGCSIGVGTVGAGIGAGAGVGIALGASVVLGVDITPDLMPDFGQDITIIASTGTTLSIMDTETR